MGLLDQLRGEMEKEIDSKFGPTLEKMAKSLDDIKKNSDEQIKILKQIRENLNER